jgi:DNA-binding transcriptional MerR regulator
MYTLSDLEKLTGIKSDTIRMWELRYGILKPARTPTNRRHYSDNDLVYLINISILLRNGSKISRIAAMLPHEVASRAAEISAETSRYDSHIDQLIAAMAVYDDEAVNEIFLDSVVRTGMEATFRTVVFPFLKRTGIMWHTGLINVGMEHFMSNIFREHIISASASVIPSKNPAPRKVLMFLPDDEYHEIGLLFYRYLILNRGHRVLYLGQSNSIESLKEVVAQWDPDILMTAVLSGRASVPPGEYLSEISNMFSNKIILAGGLLADAPSGNSPGNVHLIHDDSDLNDIL